MGCVWWVVILGENWLKVFERIGINTSRKG
jgi:hypothetical protein